MRALLQSSPSRLVIYSTTGAMFTFGMTKHGWHLSPAFDLNPNIDKAEHALNLDISGNRASLESVMSTAPYYELSTDQAALIMNEVLEVTRQWEGVAKTLAIPKGDIELMRSAFLT